jgi:hypothetical protein
LNAAALSKGRFGDEKGKFPSLGGNITLRDLLCTESGWTTMGPIGSDVSRT